VAALGVEQTYKQHELQWLLTVPSVIELFELSDSNQPLATTRWFC
jgi:hypothetical protein